MGDPAAPLWLAPIDAGLDGEESLPPTPAAPSEDAAPPQPPPPPAPQQQPEQSPPPADAPALPPSPLFTLTRAETDALRIASLLRAGSGASASSTSSGAGAVVGAPSSSSSAPPAAPPPAASAVPTRAASVQYARLVQPTPAEVDAALGGLPELLGGAGLLSGNDETEEEPFGMKRVTTKKHAAEDDTCDSWKRRRKHFFIFSAAGKPVFSRYGDENALAGFMASLQAMISFVKESGSDIRSTRTGTHLLVFLERGPLYLVCVSATGEHESSLLNQLSLLHGQLITILTSGVERALLKSPKFDMRHLLGGTDAVFASLIRAFTWDPASWLHAYSPLALPPSARRAAQLALQTSLTTQGVLGAMLLTAEQVVALAMPKRAAAMHPDDLLLLGNFVRASESFRLSESFSPVCLPRFNAAAFVYAYVSYLAPSICLVVLSASSDAFYTLAEARRVIENAIIRDKVLLAVFNAMQRSSILQTALPRPAGGGPLGSTCLWHFLYLHVPAQQFIYPKFVAPLNGHVAQKRLLRAYQAMHARVHHSGPGSPQKVHYRCSDSFCMLAVVTDAFEVYCAFDPLTDCATAVGIANRLCAWCKASEAELLAL